MFHLIGFTFIFIIFLLIFGLVAIVSIFRALLSLLLGKRFKSSSNSRAYTYSSSSADDSSDSSRTSTHRPSSSLQHKKLFDDDEGDYVEFEEV
jgi:hypothetical protein